MPEDIVGNILNKNYVETEGIYTPSVFLLIRIRLVFCLEKFQVINYGLRKKLYHPGEMGGAGGRNCETLSSDFSLCLHVFSSPFWRKGVVFCSHTVNINTSGDKFLDIL